MAILIRVGSLALLVAVLLLAAGPARAQGIIIGRPVPGPRPIPNPQPQPLRVESQSVNLQVDSGAVRSRVTEVFHNPTSANLEGTYLFNLPEGATVDNFRMQVGAEPVDGKMLNVEEARRIYETFVRQQIDPGILEYVGRNAFRARVFPIPGNSNKEIQIGYSHPAHFQNGLYQITYPLNTEKVSPSPLKSLNISCAIKSNQPIKAIYSPSHEIQVKRDSDRQATVTFEAKDIRANRDFVVYYSVSDREFGLNAMAHRRTTDDGYVMMMLAPRRDASSMEVLPKDMLFVFDTSGSMQGAKIEQAKRALNTVVGALGSKDRFNIIRFSTDTSSFKPGLIEASPENIQAGKDFVAEFKAVGGTAINDAIEAAIASLPPGIAGEKRQTFIVFMTDGLPTIGQTNIDQILTNANRTKRPNTRFFSFGVGNDVNALLLDRLALNGNGSADYVGPDEDLEARIGGFYAKIANPVLSSLKIEVAGGQLMETYPRQLPDLFAGEQLLVLARYKGSGKAAVKVSGDINGATRAYSYDVSLPAEEKDFSFVPKLWASRKIGYLLEEIRLHGESAELKNEVVRLSKEYGIITPYTAYLVEEPGLLPPGAPQLLRGFDALSERSRGAGGPAAAAGRPLSRLSTMPQGQAGPGGGAGGFGAGGAGGNLGGVRLEGGEVLRQAERRNTAADQKAFYQSTGKDAIQQSNRVKMLKEQILDAEDEVESLREVNGRRFQFQQGNWQEDTVTGKPTIVTVKFGSDAYFQLVRQNKEWAKILSLGKNVTFRANKTQVVKISETAGLETLTPAQLKALALP